MIGICWSWSPIGFGWWRGNRPAVRGDLEDYEHQVLDPADPGTAPVNYAGAQRRPRGRPAPGRPAPARARSAPSGRATGRGYVRSADRRTGGPRSGAGTAAKLEWSTAGSHCSAQASGRAGPTDRAGGESSGSPPRKPSSAVRTVGEAMVEGLNRRPRRFAAVPNGFAADTSRRARTARLPQVSESDALPQWL